ncbi:DUF4083 family protein [Ectobacillus ponti]|uniref:DUF4083 family protein n=1 Tax=Ectobacillus ponti TaxID=2961894 RepID=A0AA42BNX1_9BACI|nr:DUF4083 family protein [Ectobacillus ponti]MCP8968455.1 DUF4083 family protein [Ectobacillus ponti]
MVGLLLNVIVIVFIVGILYLLLKTVLLQTGAKSNEQVERKLDRIIALLEQQSK